MQYLLLSKTRFSEWIEIIYYYEDEGKLITTLF